jgi:hypothetical protein
MKKELPGMHAGIRPSATCDLNRMPENSGKSLLNYLLDGKGILLSLPAGIGRPIKCYFCKVPHSDILISINAKNTESLCQKEKPGIWTPGFSDIPSRVLYRSLVFESVDA